MTKLEQLYRQHHQQLSRRTRRGTTDPHAAEDAVSQAWLILERKLRENPGYLQPGTELAWLTVVARNELKHIYRSHDLEQPEPLRAEDVDVSTFLDQQPAVTSDPLDAVQVRELLRIARDQTVTHGRRQGIVMAMLGISYKDAQTATGSTYTAVNRRITEGRKHARQAVEAL